jgi:hypothetical protein
MQVRLLSGRPFWPIGSRWNSESKGAGRETFLDVPLTTPSIVKCSSACKFSLVQKFQLQYDARPFARFWSGFAKSRLARCALRVRVLPNEGSLL